MACFHPLEAWQASSGAIAFRETKDALRHLWLPCGRCIGCRLVRQRSWALRCMHEAAMHKVNSFITLTYDDDHYEPGLNYKDFQRFMYRLRQKLGPTRFFACGEYGEKTLRPHFHAILFGRTFPLPVPVGKSIYTDTTLSKLWPAGFSSFGEVTYASAAYVARYATKKITGDQADRHYIRVDTRTGEFVRVLPEMGRMSLRPGIGHTWFNKYWQDVYLARDGVVQPGGTVVPPPRFYDQLLERKQPKIRAEKEITRYQNGKRFEKDNTQERLKVREKCAIARMNFNRKEKL